MNDEIRMSGHVPSDSLREAELESLVWMLGMEIERGDPQAISSSWLVVKKLLGAR